MTKEHKNEAMIVQQISVSLSEMDSDFFDKLSSDQKATLLLEWLKLLQEHTTGLSGNSTFHTNIICKDSICTINLGNNLSYLIEINEERMPTARPLNIPHLFESYALGFHNGNEKNLSNLFSSSSNKKVVYEEYLGPTAKYAYIITFNSATKLDSNQFDSKLSLLLENLTEADSKNEKPKLDLNQSYTESENQLLEKLVTIGFEDTAIRITPVPCKEEQANSEKQIRLNIVMRALGGNGNEVCDKLAKIYQSTLEDCIVNYHKHLQGKQLEPENPAKKEQSKNSSETEKPIEKHWKSRLYWPLAILAVATFIIFVATVVIATKGIAAIPILTHGAAALKGIINFFNYIFIKQANATMLTSGFTSIITSCAALYYYGKPRSFVHTKKTAAKANKTSEVLAEASKPSDKASDAPGVRPAQDIIHSSPIGIGTNHLNRQQATPPASESLEIKKQMLPSHTPT